MLSISDLESLEETLDVMGSQPLLDDIREALAELDGQATPLTKEEALGLVAEGVTEPAWAVAWTGPARRSLSRLPAKVAEAVVEFLYGSLASNPHRVGRELKLELAGLHSARRGSYRVIYRIDDDVRQVHVLAIEHRADVLRRR